MRRAEGYDKSPYRSERRRRELLGYTDPLVVHPGDEVAVMVSSEFATYESQVVRLIHGDTSPESPGFKAEPVATSSDGAHPGRIQDTHAGSYVEVPDAPEICGSFTVAAWIWPTIPEAGVQTIVAHSSGFTGYSLGFGVPRGMPTGPDVDSAGCTLPPEGTDDGLTLRVGRTAFSLGAWPVAGRWHFVAGAWDAETGEARLLQRICERGTEPSLTAATNLGPLADGNANPVAGEPDTPLLIAAGSRIDGTEAGAHHCFNGKIERPALFDRALSIDELEALADGADPRATDGAAAVWDFAATPASGVHIADVTGSGHHGTVVNYAMRGLTGHSWDATAFTREQAPEQYGAIHFHDDDFDDSRWEEDFRFTVPEDARSGYYAVALRASDEAGSEEDNIPFFVTPAPGARRAKAAYLAPTCSYLAYANERVLFSGGHDFSDLTNIPIVVDPYDDYLGARVELGGSVYDVHTDGSGVCHSTTRRPLLSMRATARHWVTGAPRGYAFDLYLLDWLEQQGTDYDVITDEDLHFEGLDCLSDYKVLMTGCHPEYWTGPMLDALEAYLDGGGRLMYLGGNGFYWATAYDPERRHVIEVRRGFAGSRAWESHPGETQFASTGEQCGIWRHLGRPPNAIVGTGFSCQGWDAHTPGYRRLPGSFDPRAAFIFEGVGDDETIGDFGLVMNGCAGDELDRVDHALGTPSHTLVLATSAGEHSAYYLVCHEDIFVMQANTDGTNNDNVRADMVYFETANGGAVFSVSSINWFSGLSHNNYKNNVSRITANVLNNFLA
ncbi:MAG: hypothetical protein OXH20_06015 [bacterium]|nr:hypothetical protein [bacterium]MXZ31317.1 LamG domain-containing protein [Acidimicrobiia bacterium]MYJ14805.1 LamG domain-containing protein [Acidimicrobiia bacterium]